MYTMEYYAAMSLVTRGWTDGMMLSEESDGGRQTGRMISLICGIEKTNTLIETKNRLVVPRGRGGG